MKNSNMIGFYKNRTGTWYKTADSPYYSKKIKDLRQDKTKAKVLRLFDYIKRNKEMKISLYHGTSVKIWDNIKKAGHFTSPKIRNVADREQRTKGLEEVFFTTFIDYAYFYATRSAEQDGSLPVLLHLEIPLIWIKEVSDVILGTESLDEIYNEYNMHYSIQKIVEQENVSMDKIANDILDFFIEIYFNNKNNEFTIKHAVPIRFVKQTTLNSKKFLVEAVQEVIKHRGQSNRLMSLIPERLKNDEDVQKVLRETTEDEDEYSKISSLSYRFNDAVALLLNENISSAKNGYNQAYSIMNEAKDPAAKELYKKGLEASFSNYLEQDVDSSTNLPSFLANGKPLRGLAHELGLLPFFSGILKSSLVGNFLYSMKNLESNNNNSPYVFGRIMYYLVAMKENVYTLSSLGVASKEEIVEFEKRAIVGSRKAYLNFLLQEAQSPKDLYESYKYFSYRDLKNFQMPPPNKDPEAMGIIKQRTRELYLDKIKGTVERSYTNIKDEAIGSLREIYNQPFIEQDEEAQEVYIDALIENKINPSRRNSRRSHQYHNLLDNRNPITSINATFILPKWIKSNPKLIEKVQKAYKEAIRYYQRDSKRLSVEDLDPSIQENGNMKNYSRETLLESLNDPNEGVVNINFVKDDPELFNLYKKKILNILEDNKNIQSQLQYAAFAYSTFSGGSDIPEDLHLSTTASHVIANFMKNETQDNVYSVQDMLSSYSYQSDFFGPEYNVFKDPNLGNLAKEYVLKTAEYYCQNNPKSPANAPGATYSHRYEALLRDFPEILNQIKSFENTYFVDYLENVQTFIDLFRTCSTYFENSKNKNNQNIKEIIKKKIMELFPLFAKDQGDIADIKSYISNELFTIFFDDKNFVNIISSCVINKMKEPFILTKYNNSYKLTQLNHWLSAYFFSDKNLWKEALLSNQAFIQTYIDIFCLVLERVVKVFDPSQNGGTTSLQQFYQELFSFINYVPHDIREQVFQDQRALSFLVKMQQAKQQLEQQKGLSQGVQPLQQNQANALQQNKASGWYHIIKESDDHFTFDETNKDKVYDTFKNTYDKATGKSWTKDKFFRRAYNWRFYGEESGYITVREQGTGMLKLTGMAGSMKGIYRGMQELLSETVPVWGMVTKDIAMMATKAGFVQANPNLVRDNIYNIPPEVFGGATIKGVLPDGGVEFEYADIGGAVKYLIGNQSYFSLFAQI